MARVRQTRRCSARRKNGEPCRAWAINGGRVCRMHGGAAPQVRAKAGERLLCAAAYRTLVRFADSRAEREHRQMRRDAFPGGDYESAVINSAYPPRRPIRLAVKGTRQASVPRLKF